MFAFQWMSDGLALETLADVSASMSFPYVARTYASPGFLFFLFVRAMESTFPYPYTYPQTVDNSTLIHRHLKSFFMMFFAKPRVCPYGFSVDRALNYQHWCKASSLQPMNTERQHMKTPPTIRIQFEHKVRKAWLTVDAEAWHDEDGIYKVAIVNVWMDVAEVFDLLTPEDILDIESAIEPAISAENDDLRVTGHIPGPFPTL